MMLPSVAAAAASARGRRVAPGGVTLQSDWVSRSTAAGVFRAIRFDSDANVDNFRFTNGVGLDQSPAGGSVGSYVRRNPTEGIMGDGALEMEQQTDSNMSSYWCLPFDSSKSTWQFNETGYNRGPGEEFYMQVRMKTNCGGQDSTGGGGRKNFSVSRLTNSYTFQEQVVQDTFYRGVIQMYSGFREGAAYNPISTQVGGSDFDLQPGSNYAEAPAYCSYQGGDYVNQAPCATYFNGEWITYLLHIIPSDDGVSNGTTELFIWKDGWADYKRVIQATSFEMNYDSDKPDGFNAAILWIYETGRTAGAANQKQWYDQVILSTQFIARPQI